MALFVPLTSFMKDEDAFGVFVCCIGMGAHTGKYSCIPCAGIYKSRNGTEPEIINDFDDRKWALIRIKHSKDTRS